MPTPPQANEGDPKPAEDNLDSFGYEKPAEEVKPAEAIPAPTEVKPTEGEEVKPATGYGEEEVKPATGYGEKPAEEVKPTEEAKPAEGEEVKPTEALKKEEVETALGELPETYNKEKVSEFAVTNKLTKEQLDAYVEFAKNESAQSKADQEVQVKATRSQWNTELKTDPVFGGESFVKNIDRVEKMLDKHLPNMKKVLTERGSMLPPYIMKDLLGISKLLNPTTKLVGGEQPGAVEEKKGNFLEEMYS